MCLGFGVNGWVKVGIGEHCLVMEGIDGHFVEVAVVVECWEEEEGEVQNGNLWMEFHDLGLERCGFASIIRCRKPLVRAVAGCRDIHKTAETPDTAGPHLGLHSHHKETYQLVALKAP